MQTIDLGNISIGSEQVGEPQPKPAPCPTCAAKRASVSEEIIRETVTVDPISAPIESTAGRETKHRPHPGKDEIVFERCEDYKCFDTGNTPVDGQGRILDLTLRLVDVCPGKRIAVGVMLSEIDSHGNATPCGMKTFTVQARHHGHCSDVSVETVRFILPDDSTGCADGRRHFVAKVSANYIDFNSAVTSL